MRLQTHLISALILLSFTAPAVAQQSAATSEEHVAAIKKSLTDSAKVLHQYQWVETTVVSVRGKEQSRTQSECYYGVEGKLQKTPVGAPAAETKTRGPKGRSAERQKASASGATTEAIALVSQYLPPDPQKIQAAMDAGNLSLVPPNNKGNFQIVIKNYLKPGDTLTLVANKSTDRLVAMNVATYTGSAKDAVTMNGSFSAFPDGTIYPGKVRLDVKSDNVTVNVENGGYKKVGG